MDFELQDLVEYRFSAEEFEHGSTFLGNGGFGSVRTGKICANMKNRTSDLDVAIKCIPKRNELDLYKEIKIGLFALSL